jgi:DNA repair protein RAD51
VIITNEVVAQVDGSPMFAGPRSRPSVGTSWLVLRQQGVLISVLKLKAEAKFQVASEGVADVKD